jgi:hypothetical protein
LYNFVLNRPVAAIQGIDVAAHTDELLHDRNISAERDVYALKSLNLGSKGPKCATEKRFNL